MEVAGSKEKKAPKVSTLTLSPPQAQNMGLLIANVLHKTNNFPLSVSIKKWKHLWTSPVAWSSTLVEIVSENNGQAQFHKAALQVAERVSSPTKRLHIEKRRQRLPHFRRPPSNQAVCLELPCRAGSVSWLCAGWEVWSLCQSECTSKSWHRLSSETDRRPTAAYGSFFSPRHKCKGINHWEAAQKRKFIYWLWSVKRQMWSIWNVLSFPVI